MVIFQRINDAAIIFTILITLHLLFKKRYLQSPTWRATVTPLASIIGSGFLIVTPLMLMILGRLAPLAISAIALFAYLMGSVIRYNILHLEPVITSKKMPAALHNLERLSYLVLSLAYFISITFYIKLLSLFILKGFHSSNKLYSDIMTTVILGIIGIIGKRRGFKRLEGYEEYAVNIKLCIIAGLIVGLLIYNMALFDLHAWILKITTPTINLTTIRQLLGVLIIVQGFETSRYLGEKYSAPMRITTMRYAQIISGLIYIIFICFSMIMFDTIKEYNETTIIDISQNISFFLPAFLIFAAILSQFSAAIADTVSAAGLAIEALQLKIKENDLYLIISVTTIVLAWMTNVFSIVALASRAFSLYYAIQSLEATIVAFTIHRNYIKSAGFASITFVLFLSAIIGIPVA